jgi:hypothetical protein
MLEEGNGVLPGKPKQVLEGRDRDRVMALEVGTKKSLCLLVGIPMQIQIILDLDEDTLLHQAEEDRLRSLPVCRCFLEGCIGGRGLESSLLVMVLEALLKCCLCWRELRLVCSETDTVPILGHFSCLREVGEELSKEGWGDPDPLPQRVLSVELPQQAKKCPSQIIIDLPVKVGLSLPSFKTDDLLESQELLKLLLEEAGIQAGDGSEGRQREGGIAAFQEFQDSSIFKWAMTSGRLRRLKGAQGSRTIPPPIVVIGE